MAKTREIKRRIKAVKNIQRITKTMQLIATAKFQASQRRAVSAQPFTRKIAALVRVLSAALAGAQATQDGAKAISHPLLKAPSPPVNKQLVLVLTSNRGLCGGYNGNVLRTLMAYLRLEKAKGVQIDLEVVGKKGLNYLRYARVPMAAVHSQITDKVQYDQVEALAKRYMEEFTKGHYDSVQVVYMAFESASRQKPRVLQLLPLSDPAAQPQKGATPAATAPAAGKAVVTYDYSPEPQKLLAELLPVTVITQLFQCFNEAIVSEHVARMVAMKQATDAAGKMGKALSRRYNRARQAAITTELTEIIAGSSALE